MTDEPNSEYAEIAPRSWWTHTNGLKMMVEKLRNLHSDDLVKYPVMVDYVGENGREWSRRADDWHRSMTLDVEKTALQTIHDADEANEEALNNAEFDGWGCGAGKQDHPCPLDAATQPKQHAAWWTGYGKGVIHKEMHDTVVRIKGPLDVTITGGQGLGKTTLAGILKELLAERVNIKEAQPTLGNATFYYLKKSGKWYETSRGNLPAEVFEKDGEPTWVDNVTKRTLILKANSNRMPGLSTTGSAFDVLVVGDEDLSYGFPILLKALED